MRCASGQSESGCNPGFPEHAAGALFWFGHERHGAMGEMVMADSRLDTCALGYTYEGLACPTAGH